MTSSNSIKPLLQKKEVVHMNLNFLSKYSSYISNLLKLFHVSCQLIKRGEYRGYDYIHSSDILSQHIEYADVC